MSELNQDFRDLLQLFLEERAVFLIVGAHALAAHGVARSTGDIDLWIQPGRENTSRVWRALARFGAPLESLDLEEEDLNRGGNVIQLGLPPRRIDILTRISGVEFESAWKSRVIRMVGTQDLPFLSRDDLLRNKRASGRPKDLADIALLEE